MPLVEPAIKGYEKRRWFETCSAVGSAIDQSINSIPKGMWRWRIGDLSH